jgi:predicted permease
MLSDLRFALRSLLKTPGFTLVAVLTMAVAIGANTALFSVLQAVVLRPLPYSDPDTLVSIWVINRERNLEVPAVSWAKYEMFRERTDVFSEIAMSAGNGFTLTEGAGEPEQVFGLHASANFLPLHGLRPLRGRHFTADEDREGGPDVAMISAQLWRTRFGSDPEIIGRAIRIDGVVREVVGVLPEPMPVPYNSVGVMVPRPRELPFITPEQRDNAIVHSAIARLAPGVTLEQARLRVNEMVQQFKAKHAGHLDANNSNELRTISEQVVGNLKRPFWALSGAVAAVLLIACANITNLFLARVSGRQKEIAVRLSLGAQRGAIVRQFITESLVFTVIAGGLGVLLAWWSLEGIQALAGPQLPRADEIGLDANVLGFSLVAALMAGLLIGLYPAWHASRTDVQFILKDAGRGTLGGKAAKTFRQILVVAQVAMSLTLLICAGLFMLSFYKLQHTDPGFEIEGRAVGIINLPSAGYNEPERGRAFYRQLQQRLDAAPELAAGGAITGLPLSNVGAVSPYSIQGRPIAPVHERPLANVRFVTPGYLQAMGLRLREGRWITTEDRFETESVAVINEGFAKKLFPNESPLNRAFLIGRNTDVVVRIVGVVQDVKAAGLAVPAPDEIYHARDQRGGNFMQVVGQVKPGLNAAAAIPVLRRILAEIDPTLALSNPQTIEQLVDQSIGVQRVTMALLIAFAGIAALLAAVGVYSVMAYTVTQRTGEIGVRMALGAGSGDILRLILHSGARQVGAGLALGLLGAFAATRLLQQMLYEVQPFDPAVFVAVVIGFAGVALLACLIPARTATKVDPMVALRTE